MAEARKPLTVRSIEAMKSGEVLWDGAVRGLYIEFRGRGRQYRLKARVAGRQRHFTIGTHGSPMTPEKARRAALAILDTIGKGGDPASARERARNALTVADVAKRFLGEHCGVAEPEAEKFAVTPGAAVKPGTARGYRDALRDYVLPAIGKLRVDAVSTADVAAIHHRMGSGTGGKAKPNVETAEPKPIVAKRHGRKPSAGAKPRAANHMLSAVSVMVNWAMQRKLWPKGENPAEGIKRFAERRRTKYLNADETKRLVAAIGEAEASEAISLYSAAALRFLLLTGLRPREALTLQWPQVDFATGTLNLQATKTGDRTAALSSHARELLADLPTIEGNPFVFCGLKEGKPLASLQNAFEVVRARAKLGSDVVLYTLRHNFGSALAHNRVEAYEIMRAMGHRNLSTSLRYIHLASEGVSASATRATQHIADALGASKAAGAAKPTAEVVSIGKRSA